MLQVFVAVLARFVMHLLPPTWLCLLHKYTDQSKVGIICMTFAFVFACFFIFFFLFLRFWS